MVRPSLIAVTDATALSDWCGDAKLDGELERGSGETGSGGTGVQYAWWYDANRHVFALAGMLSI